jgi:hypothetical protein
LHSNYRLFSRYLAEQPLYSLHRGAVCVPAEVGQSLSPGKERRLEGSARSDFAAPGFVPRKGECRLEGSARSDFAALGTAPQGVKAVWRGASVRTSLLRAPFPGGRGNAAWRGAPVRTSLLQRSTGKRLG